MTDKTYPSIMEIREQELASKPKPNLNLEEAEQVMRGYPDDGRPLLARLADALANAEARGMERAAEIIAEAWKSTPNERTDDVASSFLQNERGPGFSEAIKILQAEAQKVRGK